jgi:hypothetical protein
MTTGFTLSSSVSFWLCWLTCSETSCGRSDVNDSAFISFRRCRPIHSWKYRTPRRRDP